MKCRCGHSNRNFTCQYYRFAAHPTKQKYWKELLGIQETVTIPSTVRICSCHFLNGQKSSGPQLNLSYDIDFKCFVSDCGHSSENNDCEFMSMPYESEEQYKWKLKLNVPRNTRLIHDKDFVCSCHTELRAEFNNLASKKKNCGNIGCFPPPLRKQQSHQLFEQLVLKRLRPSQTQSKPPNSDNSDVIKATENCDNKLSGINNNNSHSSTQSSTQSISQPSHDDKIFGLHVARSFIGLNDQEKFALQKNIRKCINNAHAISNPKINCIILEETDDEMENDNVESNAVTEFKTEKEFNYDDEDNVDETDKFDVMVEEYLDSDGDNELKKC